MSTPVTATVPHWLGKDEAVRRLKSGLSRMANNLGGIITIEQEVWRGDQLTFQMRGLGQAASGTIDVREDSLLISVTLPWLLAKIADQFMPKLKQEATLLLEKK
jgi:Putative polyhydroxyalkanoic acid system protein (PHA_gran_rgn)